MILFYLLPGLVLSLVSAANGYDYPDIDFANTDVVELTPENFDSIVLNNRDLWIVLFYADWCNPSKRMAPEYIKMATNLKGLVKVGAIDASKHKVIRRRYTVRAYPTILIFSGNKDTPEKYLGKKLAGYMTNYFKQLALKN